MSRWFFFPHKPPGRSKSLPLTFVFNRSSTLYTRNMSVCTDDGRIVPTLLNSKHPGAAHTAPSSTNSAVGKSLFSRGENTEYSFRNRTATGETNDTAVRLKISRVSTTRTIPSENVVDAIDIGNTIVEFSLRKIRKAHQRKVGFESFARASDVRRRARRRDKTQKTKHDNIYKNYIFRRG